MRHLSLALATVTAAACNSNVTFDLQSTMEAETRGVALFGWGNVGVAGMMEQTCTFDAAQGVVLGDVVDLPGADDHVLDGNFESALVASDGAVWNVTQWGETWAVESDLNVVDAAFGGQGTVLVGERDGGCRLAWEGRGEQSVNLDCAATTVEAAQWDADVFLADGTDVVRVNSGELEVIEQFADLLAFDDSTRTLVIAARGGSFVRAITPAGDTLWTVELAGQVVGLDTLGEQGMSIVTFAHDDGTGEVVVLDNQDGSVRADHGTPTPADVSASPDGDDVALVTETNAHFYDVMPRNAFGASSVTPTNEMTFGD